MADTVVHRYMLAEWISVSRRSGAKSGPCKTSTVLITKRNSLEFTFKSLINESIECVSQIPKA